MSSDEDEFFISILVESVDASSYTSISLEVFRVSFKESKFLDLIEFKCQFFGQDYKL